MTRLGRRLQTYFGPFVRALLVTIGISPFLPWLLRDVPGLGYIGQAIDAWFSFQCHRDPARSLPWLGGSLPVCSRCFGVYAGLGLRWVREKGASQEDWARAAGDMDSGLDNSPFGHLFRNNLDCGKHAYWNFLIVFILCEIFLVKPDYSAS